MIKTKSFLSVFLLLIITFSLSVNLLFAEDTLGVITLPPSNKPQLNIADRPSVFLPSKLVIGQENKFTIKGKPGSKVSLAISSSNRGSQPLMGHKLRLGETEETIEGVVSATGAVELSYNIPDNEALVNKIKYFEVAIWNKEDFSDLEIAITISPSGKETRNNGVIISLPPATGKTPSFAPVMPGMGQEIIRSIEHVKDIQEGEINPDLLDDGSAPAYLDSPEKRDIMLQNIDANK